MPKSPSHEPHAAPDTMPQQASTGIPAELKQAFDALVQAHVSSGAQKQDPRLQQAWAGINLMWRHLLMAMHDSSQSCDLR